MHIETCHTAAGGGPSHRTAPHRTIPHHTDTIQKEPGRKKERSSKAAVAKSQIATHLTEERKQAQEIQQQRPGNTGRFPMPDDTSMSEAL